MDTHLSSCERRLRAYIREQAASPRHRRWVEGFRRQVAVGQLDQEPLDAEGLQAYLQRGRRP
jgi:hypothetical protein